MAAQERRPKRKAHARTVQASIVQAMCDIAEAGGVPYTAEIARVLGKDKSNVSRELRALRARGRVVRGPRMGRIVPYYLREWTLW